MKNNDELNQKIQKALNNSTQDLPEHITDGLLQARKKALAAQTTKQASPSSYRAWNKELMAIAACISLIVPVWFLSAPESKSPIEVQSMDLMVSFAELDDDEWELVDDLEFALWLSEQNQLEAET